MRSECFGKELPPLSNFIQTKNFFCKARKNLGTSLALQRYAGFVSSGFPVKSRKVKEMTRGDKGKLFSLFVPLFTLPTQQDCVLPVFKLERIDVYLIRVALYEQLQPAITMLSLLRGTNVLTLIIDRILD